MDMGDFMPSFGIKLQIINLQIISLICWICLPLNAGHCPVIQYCPALSQHTLRCWVACTAEKIPCITPNAAQYVTQEVFT